MNKSKPFPWGLALVSLLAVAAIVISVLPNTGLLPAAPTDQATNTPGPTFTPDPCAGANLQTTASEFNGFAREFDDRLQIAQNTARDSLSPEIAGLQDIRRRAESYSVPECLANLKNLQLSYMNAYIETLLFLFGPTGEQITCTETEAGTQCTGPAVEGVNQGMSIAIQYYTQYLLELGNLLGVELITLTPTPTIGPEGPLPDTTPTPTP